MVLSFESFMRSVTIQMTTTQFFHVVLFVILYKVSEKLF